MYKKVANFLRGSVRLQIESPYPERIVNLCSVHGVPFWSLQWQNGETFTLRTSPAGERRLREVTQQVECRITREEETGAPRFLRRLRTHRVLVAGLVLFCLLLFGGNLFIWEFRVTGNDTVPAETILRALEEYGITVGTVGMHIDQEAMRNHVLLEVPDLSWLVVNVKGCTAHVQVVERQRPPQIINDDEISNVVALRSGLVTRVEALDGKAQVSVGSTVIKGQLLISGVVDSGQSGVRLVHGMGEVWARTWYELAVLVPLQANRYTQVEKETTKISLLFGKQRIKLYAKGSVLGANCDKIIQYEPLTLPGGLRLPLTLVKEKTLHYSTETTVRSADAAQREGEAVLLRLLEQQLDGRGSIELTRFSATEKKGVLLVSLTAECHEQIGQQVLLPET